MPPTTTTNQKPSPPPPPPILTPQVKAIIKSTAPVLAARGTDITTTFYPILFKDYPQVRSLFNSKNQQPETEGDQTHAHLQTPPPPKVGAQPAALANAVYAYAAHIDDLSVLTSTVRLIAHKHASLHVLPEHYPMVGASLLKAISVVLGEEIATPAVMEAWEQAYGFLANIFIDAENGLRDANAHKAHGWVGWKELKVAKKVKESEDVCSFYLMNVDGKTPVCSYEAGQYISFRVTLPDGSVQERDYSLSEYGGLCAGGAGIAEVGRAWSGSSSSTTSSSASSSSAAAAEGGGGEGQSKEEKETAAGKTTTTTTTPTTNDNSPLYFRVSIKRIPGGVVSNYFHSQVKEGTLLQVGPPYGDFTLALPSLSSPTPTPTPTDTHTRPIVFLSAGIGLTPLMAMTDSLLLDNKNKTTPTHTDTPTPTTTTSPPKIFFLHTARNGALFPFASHLHKLASTYPSHFHLHVSFTQPRPDIDILDETHHAEGRTTATTLYHALSGLYPPTHAGVRPQECVFYLCGPSQYMIEMKELLGWLGVPMTQVIFESFGPLVPEVVAAGAS